MRKTTYDGFPKDSFSIRACPIWSIPQIAFMRKYWDGEIMSAYFSNKGVGDIYIRIDGASTYVFQVYREDMNNPQVRELTWVCD